MEFSNPSITDYGIPSSSVNAFCKFAVSLTMQFVHKAFKSVHVIRRDSTIVSNHLSVDFCVVCSMLPVSVSVCRCVIRFFFLLFFLNRFVPFSIAHCVFCVIEF